MHPVIGCKLGAVGCKYGITVTVVFPYNGLHIAAEVAVILGRILCVIQINTQVCTEVLCIGVISCGSNNARICSFLCLSLNTGAGAGLALAKGITAVIRDNFLQTIGVGSNSSDKIAVRGQIVLTVTALHGLTILGNRILRAEICKFRSFYLYRYILDTCNVVAGDADISLVISVAVCINKTITGFIPRNRMVIVGCAILSTMDDNALLEAAAVQTMVGRCTGNGIKCTLVGFVMIVRRSIGSRPISTFQIYTFTLPILIIWNGSVSVGVAVQFHTYLYRTIAVFCGIADNNGIGVVIIMVNGQHAGCCIVGICICAQCSAMTCALGNAIQLDLIINRQFAEIQLDLCIAIIAEILQNFGGYRLLICCQQLRAVQTGVDRYIVITVEQIGYLGDGLTGNVGKTLITKLITMRFGHCFSGKSKFLTLQPQILCVLECIFCTIGGFQYNTKHISLRIDLAREIGEINLIGAPCGRRGQCRRYRGCINFVSSALPCRQCTVCIDFLVLRRCGFGQSIANGCDHCNQAVAAGLTALTQCISLCIQVGRQLYRCLYAVNMTFDCFRTICINVVVRGRILHTFSRCRTGYCIIHTVCALCRSRVTGNIQRISFFDCISEFCIIKICIRNIGGAINSLVGIFLICEEIYVCTCQRLCRNGLAVYSKGSHAGRSSLAIIVSISCCFELSHSNGCMSRAATARTTSSSRSCADGFGLAGLHGLIAGLYAGNAAACGYLGAAGRNRNVICVCLYGINLAAAGYLCACCGYGYRINLCVLFDGQSSLIGDRHIAYRAGQGQVGLYVYRADAAAGYAERCRAVRAVHQHALACGGIRCADRACAAADDDAAGYLYVLERYLVRAVRDDQVAVDGDVGQRCTAFTNDHVAVYRLAGYGLRTNVGSRHAGDNLGKFCTGDVVFRVQAAVCAVHIAILDQSGYAALGPGRYRCTVGEGAQRR